MEKTIVRMLISMWLLLWVAMPATATSYDELLRIKKNLCDMLVPSDADAYGLKAMLASLPPEQEMSDQVVVELHQRYPFDLEKLASWLSTLSADGTWNDIDYADKKRSGWEPKVHAERILELVKLYCSRQTAYYHSEQVEKAVHEALRYWFAARPVCPNWWYNQIGIPKTLGTAFILFEDRLTPEERKDAVAVMENARFGMTGQNKVWLAGNVLMRALLQNDAELVKMARDTIASEIVTGMPEGIKADWSFHQHGAQQQFGNYGLSFVSAMSFYSSVFAGTSLTFDENQLGIIRRLIDEGYRWIVWKGKLDISALDRQLFHHAQVHKALALAFVTSELGGGESEACTLLAQTFREENFGTKPSSNPLTGHKHFWQSDYTIHRRPGWMASVKMASERVIGVEMMNGDNMKGFYMADGATYVYRDGEEYLDIFPLWDWRRLPGVTAFQSDAPMPLIHYYDPRNEASFVGGISDGKQGMSAMEINRAGIKAHKAWVFTDDYVLCLGAGIQADSNLVVATAIEQCHRRGDLNILRKGTWEKVTGSLVAHDEELRLFHNGIGYIAWGNRPNCVAEVVSRTGQWHDVMQMYRPQQVSGEVVSIHLEHGVSPSQATYQYLILPDTGLAGTAEFDLSAIRILRNDESVQAVCDVRSGTYWITAYSPVSLTLAPNLPLDIRTPGIYMLRKQGKGYVLGCTDPTQKLADTTLSFCGKEVSVSFSGREGETVCADL